MQTLVQTLQDHDRGHLAVIAQLWGMDLPNEPIAKAAEDLSNAMIEGTPAMIETLPGGARRAMERLQVHGGRLPMESLVRQFGPLREMGPGKRDRLAPWKEPASPLEMLWYRGLVAKAFADSNGGPQEYGFIPDDLLAELPEVSEQDPGPLGHSVAPPAQFVEAGSFAVDDATTILAAKRRAEDMDLERLKDFLHQQESFTLLEGLLKEMRILESPDQIRRFLELPRQKALRALQESWRESAQWNDLSQTPGVTVPAGDWPNVPLEGRLAATSLLRSVPTDRWWSLSSFVEAAREAEPSFMRPAGGFESWYLQSSDDRSSLRGFEAWDQVEGRYLEYLITGPMHWLGLADVSQDHAVFHLISDRTMDLEGGQAKVWADGRVRVGRGADRILRYQLARLCDWEQMDTGAYHYRLTAGSLLAAEESGLTAAHALKVLGELSAPEGLLKALKRWERFGIEANVKQRTILQVEDPKVLELLLKEPGTARYIQDRLGSRSAVVDPRHWSKLQETALKLGLFIGAPRGEAGV